jgi:hypothetical protein
VLAVQVRRGAKGDEELRAIGVAPRVGHGQQVGAVMAQAEVLIRKLLAVDGLAAGAVAAGEVATLKHELRDDAVEDAALEVQRLATLAHALLTRAEGAEVLDRLGHSLAVQIHDDAASGLRVNLNVEEDLVGHFRTGLDDCEDRSEECKARHVRRSVQAERKFVLPSDDVSADSVSKPKVKTGVDTPRLVKANGHI